MTRFGAVLLSEGGKVTAASAVDGPMSIEDMPVVARMARCALPLIFTSADYPEWSGIRGTCFAVRKGAHCVFVTAAHVVRELEATSLEVPLGFGVNKAISQIGAAIVPHPVTPEHETACDVAVLVPVAPPPFIGDDSVPLDISQLANVQRVAIGAPFAVCGYPQGGDGNVVNYDTSSASFMLHHELGTYRGASPFVGCHELALDTSKVGGPDGLSGSPVLRILADGNGAWTAGLSGVVTNGGPSNVHFIDIACLLGPIDEGLAACRW